MPHTLTQQWDQLTAKSTNAVRIGGGTILFGHHALEFFGCSYLTLNLKFKNYFKSAHHPFVLLDHWHQDSYSHCSSGEDYGISFQEAIGLPCDSESVGTDPWNHQQNILKHHSIS